MRTVYGPVENFSPDEAMNGVFRHMYSRMHYVPIVEIAYALKFVQVMRDKRKIMRFINRVQETIEVTNPQLLPQVFNQGALLEILKFFKKHQLGSLSLREKVALILQKMIEEKLWVKLSGSAELTDLISCLRDIDVARF